MGRLTRAEYFLEMLDLVAARSTCARRSVGAIITDGDGHILSTGYNGVPRHMDHCTDHPCPGTNDPKGDTSNCYAVHAEQNALLQCSNMSAAHTMYVSCAPCFVCAKMIANTNIRRVVFSTEYHGDSRGVKLLTSLNISCELAVR
jgi:dCMP deaminase